MDCVWPAHVIKWVMPNLRKMSYRCKTCGVDIAPYDFYCERHRDNDGRDGQNGFLDRFIYRIFGRGDRD